MFFRSFILLTFNLLLSFSSKGAGHFTVEGIVRNSKTKEPMQGVSVAIKDSQSGVVTDKNGYYKIYLPNGNYWILFTSIGYTRESKFINVKSNVILDIELSEKPVEIEEVVVTDENPDKNVTDIQMSRQKVDLKALKKMPALFGESDIIKAILLQPGVATVGEGAGGFNVRGGRVDQNLVLLDGAPLFNTSHLLGFYSNINTDLLKDATLLKGAIPATYGGRLSSILSMTSKNGDMEKIKGMGAISFMSGRFQLEGPIVKNKVTFVAGARIAFPNWMISQFREPTNHTRAFFYDANFKLNWKINANNYLSFTGYQSYDNFRFTKDTTNHWRSSLISLNYNTSVSRTLNFFLNLNQSTYKLGLEGNKESFGFRMKSTIRHREVKFLLNYTNANFKVEIGGNSIFYKINPGAILPTHNSTIAGTDIDDEGANENSLHLNGEADIIPSISVQVGLRGVYFRNIGPQMQYVYHPGKRRSEQSVIDTVYFGKGNPVAEYGGLEPRLAVRFEVADNASIKISYNRMRQYLHLISNTTAMSPVDYWKLSDGYIPPQLADQYSAGVFYNVRDNMFEASIEGFYKETDNLVEYKNGALLFLNPQIETALLPASGLAYGVEFSVGKRIGKLTGQVGYTYSRAVVKVKSPFPIERINKGRYYSSNFDIPHNIAFSSQLILKRGWTISSGFIYNTGRPITYPDGKYIINFRPVNNYSKRNADRIPDYHRLDLSFSKDTRLTPQQKRYSVWVISIYNLYARKNPYSIYFTHNYTITRSYRLSVLGTIIPSLSYTYYF